ncbi:hypothetical protein HDA40_007703 [Hamadaea flava]|uniref:DUF4190 domain-containing protein n=1 Tax=Hamadaea flava TaxID=1742688 RepID=A0ABV8LX75_9ACTN|nr:hypothetical protein [Hamadaea flava]MCP2329196.1 hypothetical protein [Hamadaea flava]
MSVGYFADGARQNLGPIVVGVLALVCGGIILVRARSLADRRGDAGPTRFSGAIVVLVGAVLTAFGVVRAVVELQ